MIYTHTDSRIRYLTKRDNSTARALHTARNLLKADPYNTDLMDTFRLAVRAYTDAHRALYIAKQDG